MESTAAISTLNLLKMESINPVKMQILKWILALNFFWVLSSVHANFPTYEFTTLAGQAGIQGSNNTQVVAKFNTPLGVTLDGAGNIYVADSGNNTVRKITPAGTVTTLAGQAGVQGSSDGIGSSASFYGPGGLVVDDKGNVYVADYYGCTIRKITPAGMVTTLAGQAGVQGSSDGIGSSASFYRPTGVAVDSKGNVFVADTYSIRKVSPAGVVTTLAGHAGTLGSSDGSGSTAEFSYPAGVAVDSKGNVFVADCGNNRIRKVSPTGIVTTFAGQFNQPYGVSLDSKGNLYVTDSGNNTICKITPTGMVTILAGQAGVKGSSDGTARNALFYAPTGVAVDKKGGIYIADSYNNTIRKVSPTSVVTTLAGQAGISGGSDSGQQQASFNDPGDVVVDNSGNVYVADTDNHLIRKVTAKGVVTTFAGNMYGSADGIGSKASFRNPTGVAKDSKENIYVADGGNNTIRKITPAGKVTTLAGQALVYGSADGIGSQASFNFPIGVALDSKGNIYVADSGNNTIRKITPAGKVTTLAGQAPIYGSTDGIGDHARFYYPTGIASDSRDNIYVADSGNNTIRKISPIGLVTTLAGQAGVRGSTDGTGSQASFNSPAGVSVDSKGNIYVTDDYSIIRKISPMGVVTTIAGQSGIQGSSNGVGSQASFSSPAGVSVDSKGNIYVSDLGDDIIRKGVPVFVQ